MSDGQILLIIFGVYLLLMPVMAGLFKAVNAANVMEMDGKEAFVWPVILAFLIILHIAVGIWIAASWVYNHVSGFFEKVFKKIFGVKDELQKE